MRALWRFELSKLDPAHLVFIDETWTKDNMTRLWGRAMRGERLVDYTPHGHWTTITFLAALRLEGMTAPLTVDGPINADVFLAWVQQQLVQTLKPGDVVLMDNLNSHKGVQIRKAIEAVGARVVFLPPYSPDFNPIEMVFSKLKALLRKAKERTIDDLNDRLGELMDHFPPDECARYFRHCGYRVN